MKKKTTLPGSFDEVAALSPDALKDLWLGYFSHVPLMTDQKMLRALWYKIQCEHLNLHLDQKHITRLNRYSVDPEACIEKSCKTRYHIRSGTEIVKTYKGRQYRVLVRAQNEFVYNDQSFKTLSAVALAICHKKVSGYDFFGLDNKQYAKNIIERIPETDSEKSIGVEGAA